MSLVTLSTLLYFMINSLVELEEKNASISDYQFGQPHVTSIIENNLRNISFRGASGYIEFNDFREVHTPIDIFQIVNGTSVLVGTRIVFNSSLAVKQIKINFSVNLDDKVPTIYQTVPLWVTVVLILSVMSFFVLTTIVLSLFIKFRHSKEIKAKSVKFSMLMFLGCYAFVTVEVIIIFLTSVELSFISYSILCNLEYCILLNGTVMVFGTLYLKTERIYRIFHNKSLTMYNWKYSNWALYARAVALCVVGCIIFITSISIKPIQQQFVSISEPYESKIASSQYPYCHIETISKYVLYTFYFYLGAFLLLILYVSSKLRNIRLKNFKDTKRINLFLVLTFVTLSLAIPLRETFFVNNKNVLYFNVANFYGTFFIGCSALFTLFVPSVYVSLKARKKFAPAEY